MSMKRNIILWCSAFLIGALYPGCYQKPDEQPSDGVETIKVSSLKKVPKLRYNDANYFEDCFLVKLETTNESLIKDINQIQLMDSVVYILDRTQAKILSFSYDGKYLGKIGVMGQGPEEYIAISSFYVDKIDKSINLIDPMSMSIIRYSASGAFLNRVKHNNSNASFIKNAQVMNEDEIFCYSGSGWEDNSLYSIVSRSSFEKIKDICYYPAKTDAQISYTLSRQPFSIHDGKVTYGMLFSDVIERYEDGDSKPYLRFDHGKKSISPESLQQRLESREYNYDYIQLMRSMAKGNDYTPGFLDVVESSRFIVADFQVKESFMSVVVWDKKENKGIYVEEYGLISTPDFGTMDFYDDGTIVKVWSNGSVNSFKSEINKDEALKKEYPAHVEAILNQYDEDDNPVLVFYKLKG